MQTITPPTGTNTYLVGESNPFILVDTGQGYDSYIPLLEEALDSSSTSRDVAEVNEIILTHKHHDHIGGLPSVLALLRRRWVDSHPGISTPFPAPRIHKLPLATPQLSNMLGGLSPDLYTSSPSGGAIHDIHEGQTFAVTPGGSLELALEVIHTPGHTDDSLCLFFPADRALFTADTVLGQSSTVFEDLGLYMTSLRKLSTFNGGEGDTPRKYDTLYPGHGPTVPHDHVEMYLRHRVDRENQVLEAIAAQPKSGDAWTTWTLVQKIYASYPQELWEPAAVSIDQHLKKLQAEGRVSKLGGEERHTEWKLNV